MKFEISKLRSAYLVDLVENGKVIDTCILNQNLSILSRFADETEAKLSIDASIQRLAKDVLLDTKISYLKAFATKFELIKFQISEKETAATILEAELAKQAVRIAEYKEEEKTIKSSKAPGRVRISL